MIFWVTLVRPDGKLKSVRKKSLRSGASPLPDCELKRVERIRLSLHQDDDS
jgi:hypothetical protein